MKQFFRLFAYAKPYLPKLILGFFLVVLVGQSPLFMPLVQKFVIDTLLTSANKPLASVNLTFRDNLDNQAGLSNTLRQELDTQGLLFSASTVVSIEKRGEKWRLTDTETGEKYRINQKVFKLNSKFQEELDAPQGVSNELHKEFKDRDILLSSKTTILVEEAGSHWLIIDEATGKQHTVRRENGKLFVAEGEIKVYIATVTYTLLGREFHYTLIDWLTIILFVIIIYYAIFGVLSYFCTYVMTWVSQRILFDLRNKVFSHLQSLSMRFYDVQGTGQILSRVREDVVALRSLATETSIRIVTDAVTFVLMLGIMLYWNWKLTLFSLLIFPLIIGNYHLFIKRLRPMWRQWRHKWADISTGMYEAVAGAKVVKAFHRNGIMSDSYSITCARPLNRESKSPQPKRLWGASRSFSGQSAGQRFSVMEGT